MLEISLSGLVFDRDLIPDAHVTTLGKSLNSGLPRVLVIKQSKSPKLGALVGMSTGICTADESSREISLSVWCETSCIISDKAAWAFSRFLECRLSASSPTSVEAPADSFSATGSDARDSRVASNHQPASFERSLIISVSAVAAARRFAACRLSSLALLLSPGRDMNGARSWPGGVVLPDLRNCQLGAVRAGEQREIKGNAVSPRHF